MTSTLVTIFHRRGVAKAVLPERRAALVEKFHERLRRLRDEHGFTVAALADAAGCSEGAIRQLESGRIKSPSLVLGIRLADVLRVDPRYLGTGEALSTAEQSAAITARLEQVERQIAHLQRGR
ncbi:MAG TPA: helix-turn-helix transcriptional regulator [Candidatus Elarobacter sp.]